MNDAEFNHLLEKSWREPLTPAEEALLQSHLPGNPDAQADLEADRVLTGVLTNLPNAPISSNFTSLVLQAVDREVAVSARQGGVAEWLRNLLRRPASGLAWTGAAAAILFIGLNQYSAHQRAQLANNELVNSVVQISSAAALPDPRVFQDFDVIQGLGQMPPADDAELIRVLDQ